MPQFTDNANIALRLADRAAKSMHQSYVGSEHILLGLLREGTGVAATVLNDGGVSEARVTELIQIGRASCRERV